MSTIDVLELKRCSFLRDRNYEISDPFLLKHPMRGLLKLKTFLFQYSYFHLVCFMNLNQNIQVLKIDFKDLILIVFR